MPLSNSDGLGIGQTWQNLTASRALGTVYTNSTSKPIAINLCFSGAAGLFPWINGVALAQIGNAGSGSSTIGQVHLIVESGDTYALSSSGASLTGAGLTLQGWNELR